MDSPRTEAALAAALPLEGLDAWRIYLGLPMSGSRLPSGGVEELMRLGYEDAVRNLHGPIINQAAEEFMPAFTELRARFGFGNGPIGVIGGSAGAAVAQLVIAESDVEIAAAVLVSPLVQLHPVVEALGRHFGITYPWSQPSLAIAHRLDFVARVQEIALPSQPAILLVVGEDDDRDAIRTPATRMCQELAKQYVDPARVQLMLIPGMAHALAEEPGVEPAPQTAHAAKADRHTVSWLQRHLASSVVTAGSTSLIDQSGTPESGDR